jgi:hypothetical protein
MSIPTTYPYGEHLAVASSNPPPIANGKFSCLSVSPALKNLQKRATGNTSILQYERTATASYLQAFQNHKALFHDNPNLQKVPTDMPQDRIPHGTVPGKDDYSQDNAHALFQHSNPPNLFANLEIEPPKSQTRRKDGVILQRRRAQALVAVRTPPTELCHWSTYQPKKNLPISGDQRNATEPWTQHSSSPTWWFNNRDDHESPSIPPSSSIRVVPTLSVVSESHTLGLELNAFDKTKSGKPNTPPASPRRAG